MANIDYSKNDFIDINNQLFRRSRNNIGENATPIKNIVDDGKAKDNLQIYGSEFINNLNQINYTLDQIETYLFIPSKVVKTKGNQIVVSDDGGDGGTGETETIAITPTTPLSVIKAPTKPLDSLPIELEEGTSSESLEFFNIMIAKLKSRIKERRNKVLATGVEDPIIDELEDKLEDMENRRDTLYPSQTTSDVLDADVDVVDTVVDVVDTVVDDIGDDTNFRVNPDLNFTLEQLDIIIPRYEIALKKEARKSLSTGQVSPDIQDIEDELDFLYQKRDLIEEQMKQYRDLSNLTDTEQTMKNIEAIMKISQGLEEKERLTEQEKQAKLESDKLLNKIADGYYGYLKDDALKNLELQREADNLRKKVEMISEMKRQTEGKELSKKKLKEAKKMELPFSVEDTYPPMKLNESLNALIKKEQTNIGKPELSVKDIQKLLKSLGFNTNFVNKLNSRPKIDEYVKNYDESSGTFGSGRYRGGAKKDRLQVDVVRDAISSNPKFKLTGVKKDLLRLEGINQSDRNAISLFNKNTTKGDVLSFLDTVQAKQSKPSTLQPSTTEPLVLSENPEEFEPLPEQPKDNAVANLEVAKKLDKILVKLTNMGQNTPVPSYLSKVAELITSLIQFIGRTTSLYITRIKKNLNYLDEEQVKLIYNANELMKSKLEMLKSYSDMSGALIKQTLYKQLEKELSGLYNQINDSIRNYTKLKDYTIFSKVGSGRSFGTDRMVGGYFIQSDNPFITHSTTKRFL